MSLGRIYCTQISGEFTGYHANFPPNQPLALGDYGTVRDEVFRRLGSIRDLPIAFTSHTGSAVSNFQFKSAGSVEVEFIGKGDLTPAGVPAARAGLEIRFSDEESVFFNAAGCTISQIADVKSLGEAIIARLQDGSWDPDYRVVTALVQAASTTALVSASSNAEVKLEASSDAIREIDLGNASLSLRLKRSRHTALEIVTANPQTPLMQLSRVKGFFHDKFVTEAVVTGGASLRFAADEEAWPPIPGPGATPAVPAESAPAFESMAMPMPEFVFESAPSDFEVSRVLDLYLPLLNASYSLARQEPFTLPVGYTKLGEVRVSTAEAVEAVVTATREEQQAIEHDREALTLPQADRVATSASTEPAVALEALADPGAFGFVLQEDATKSLIVSFRGTQTPKEWAADFVALPVPFREVQGFGWVHVGFDAFYHSVRESIRQALQGVDAGARVTVVGHSLGGAMAVLCAVDLERNMGRKNVDVCTFGGPRAGTIEFRIHFNSEIARCFRVVNKGDIVPHVPPAGIWNHVGKAVNVNGAGSSPHSLDAYRDGVAKLPKP